MTYNCNWNEEEVLHFLLEARRVGGRVDPCEEQHYIPEHFLLGWAGDGSRRIAFRHRGMKPKMVGVDDLAHEDWFYEYPDLSEYEIRYLFNLFNQIPRRYRREICTRYALCIILPVVWRLENGWYDSCTLNSIRLIARHDVLGRLARPLICEAMGRTIEDPRIKSEYLRVLKVLKRNGFEHYLTQVEHRFAHNLEALRNGDDSSLADDAGRTVTIEYMLTLFFRTTKYTDLVKKEQAKGFPYPDLVVALRFFQSFTFQAAILENLDAYDLRLIRNESDLPFITGDRPIVDIVPSEEERPFEIYFPISGRFALFLCAKDLFESKYARLMDPSAEDVRGLNRLICRESHAQVFANDPDVILRENYQVTGCNE